MPCSAVTLSLATISAIVAIALLAIAFSTDNWLSYEVKRSAIQVINNLYFPILLFLEKRQKLFRPRSHSGTYKNVCVLELVEVWFRGSVSCYFRESQ